MGTLNRGAYLSNIKQIIDQATLHLRVTNWFGEAQRKAEGLIPDEPKLTRKKKRFQGDFHPTKGFGHLSRRGKRSNRS